MLMTQGGDVDEPHTWTIGRLAVEAEEIGVPPSLLAALILARRQGDRPLGVPQ